MPTTPNASPTELSVDVCVVGGGPAGMALGVELAKLGVQVAVLEKSAQFDRSFRGESVSPDSVWLLDQLGVLERLEGKYVQMHHMEIVDAGKTVLKADFGTFPYPHPYPVEMPQPDLLAALASVGAEQPSFTLVQHANVTELTRDGDAVTGVVARTPNGPLHVSAALTVAADGRFSKVRDLSGLEFTKIPLERDVVWLRLPFPDEWDDRTYRIRIDGDQHALFLPTSPDSVRVGFNIAKAGFKEVRAAGMEALYERLDRLAPELSGSVREHVRTWTDTSILDIHTSTAPTWWKRGLTLVGDAAHTLTPILGQGVNHAIIDAVTLAPLVSQALATGDPAQLDAALARFQAEREPSVARSRSLQLRQEHLFELAGPGALARRSLYRVVNSSSWLTRRTLSGAYFQLQNTGPHAVAPQQGRATRPAQRAA